MKLYVEDVGVMLSDSLATKRTVHHEKSCRVLFLEEMEWSLENQQRMPNLLPRSEAMLA